jgi:hypothetical protein
MRRGYEEHRDKAMKRVNPFGIGLAVVFVGTPVFAQAAPAGSRQGAGADCFPACRSGFLCNKGVCVSACNPPCAANETCTSAGECGAERELAVEHLHGDAHLVAVRGREDHGHSPCAEDPVEGG